MTTMIALVGEQPQPNFLPILHYKPNTVVFVYTTRTREKYEYLKIAVEKPECKVFGIETDPYDISAIATTLNEELAKMRELSSQPLVFNLTGGTKTMSLAVYQVAAQRNDPVIYLQSEGGQSIVDCYRWQDHQLSHQRQEQLPEYLRLQDVLDLHLGQGEDAMGKKRWEEKGPSEQRDTHSHLFELAIAQILRDNGYEVMCGVKGKNNQVDIDVMIGYKNQIGIIEAKSSDTGKITNLDGVKQLSTAMRYLGGTYIRQFLVINGKPSDDLQMMCGILRIPIISLPNYKRGPNSFSLSQEDNETLLKEIDKIMKVGISKS